MRRIVLPLLIVFATLPLTPADAQDQPVIKIQVDLVNVLLSVHDKKGVLIGDLNKEDFTLYEDGKKQEIKYFTREADLPLTLGLLIDISVSQGNLIGIEQQAASQFFDEVIRPKDLAFVISFGPEADLLQDYTNSHKLLQASLKDLKVSGEVTGLHPSPLPTGITPRGTILYDALYLAGDQQLRGQVGRKALVVITDGEDQGSRYTRDQSIEAAQRADAIVYSFYYVDRQFYARYGMFMGGGGEGALKRISDDTGGRVFRIDSKHTLHDAFVELQNEMRTQYALSYVPTNSAKDNTFRRIEVRLGNKEYKAQVRKGYFATPAEQK